MKTHPVQTVGLGSMLWKILLRLAGPLLLLAVTTWGSVSTAHGNRRSRAQCKPAPFSQ